jgi:hypothetical protein
LRGAALGVLALPYTARAWSYEGKGEGEGYHDRDPLLVREREEDMEYCRLAQEVEMIDKYGRKEK